MNRFHFRRRAAGLSILALTASLVFSACGEDKKVSADAAGLGTLEPGVITVAVQAYAPYTSVVNGELTGLDADILKAAADKLGLEVRPQVTDFNGMLGGVQSHRVDMAIGGVAWTEERQKQGLFTDPAYYSPPAMAVHGDEKVQTVDDLKNRRLGTVTGYVWVKSIQAIPGAQLSAFPDANGVFNDLDSGRIDVGFLDPLIIIDALKKRPEFDFKTEYLTPPTPDQIKATPALSYLAPYQVAFYVAKEAPKLEQAISQEIDKMYTNGELNGLITKYGGEPSQFLEPSPEMSTDRQGVDRPKDWQAPGATS